MGNKVNKLIREINKIEKEKELKETTLEIRDDVELGEQDLIELLKILYRNGWLDLGQYEDRYDTNTKGLIALYNNFLKSSVDTFDKARKFDKGI